MPHSRVGFRRVAAAVALVSAVALIGAHEASAAAPAAGDQGSVAYLEIVTHEVDATCRVYGRLHGVTFAPPDASLGNARTARLPGGGRLGVRAPLRATERPVVRPYLLVADINASVAEAEAAGGRVALPPMALPGHGVCAIVILGGIEHGLWQTQPEPE